MPQRQCAQRCPMEAVAVTAVTAVMVTVTAAPAEDDPALAHHKRQVSKCCSTQLNRSSSAAAMDLDSQAARLVLYLQSR